MKTIYKCIPAFLLFVTAQLAAQVPLYNSHSSAQVVLFLDFDGHILNGTAWNYNGAVVCESSGLPEAKITEIFNRIAEDYRPFNINVTTDSAKYAAAPALQRMRALFTTSSSWYGNNAGGVAYINSFTWGDGTPCFVFTALLNYNVKNISEAGAHEIGHTLGLSHQATYDANCGKTSEYNYGTGNGEIGWAPIMGVGYYKNFTVWHNGSDPYGCASTQNDLDVITNAYNGFGYRTDDHSNSFAAATGAVFSNNSFNANGVISKTDDIDVFKFTLAANSRFQLLAVPYNVGTGNTGSDLDMQVDLVDNAGNTIGVYNPGNALSSIADTMLIAGTYYLKVDGSGNQYTSEYGSMGSYSLQGIYTTINPLPLRKLQLSGLTESGRHRLSWLIDADEVIVKQVLQVSTDGRTYRDISEVPTGKTTYACAPLPSGAAYYRLQVTFDNGRTYLSNILALKNEPAMAPQLVTNLIRTNLIMINSPSKFNYSVMDYNGRKVATGIVVNGTSSISTNNISNGSYIIIFTDGQQQFVEKFVKQ
jgi:hypothetical protein